MTKMTGMSWNEEVEQRWWAFVGFVNFPRSNDSVAHRQLQGWPKRGHCARPLHLPARTFKKPERICMILALCNAVLFWTNPLTLTSSNTQHNGAALRTSATQIYYGNFSIKCWAEPGGAAWSDRLLNEIDSSSVLKDCKTEAVSGLLETEANVAHCCNLICSEAWRKVLQASGISEWWRRLECVTERWIHETYL